MTKYDGDDIYCDLIIPKKIDLEVVHETKNVLVYHHTKPTWETHLVVVPKIHVDDLSSLSQMSTLAFELLSTVQKTAEGLHKSEGAARVITNLGDYQDSKHLHFHICSGKQLS